ncbi:MAG: manno-octulosonate cytidylyltransferase [Pseudomonadota bacterium]
MSVLIVIPARYPSTRYPGKPLVELRGATGEARSLIQRSWEAARRVAGVDRIVIATDDERIRRAAEGFGAETVMTSDRWINGTERVAEAHAKLGGDYGIVVNFQGDAPLTPAWFVEDLIAGLKTDAEADVATPVLRCNGRALSGLADDRKAGRVGGTTAVFTGNNHALYFSKRIIPFTSRHYDADAPTPVFHHVGIYAYRPVPLAAYAKMAVGPLEDMEGLEQLRFLENDRRILCIEVDARGRRFWEINNPEDVPRVEAMMTEMRMP